MGDEMEAADRRMEKQAGRPILSCLALPEMKGYLQNKVYQMLPHLTILSEAKGEKVEEEYGKILMDFLIPLFNLAGKGYNGGR